MSTSLAVVLTLVAASFGTSGIALLVRRTAMQAGALMVASGVVGVLAVVLLATETDGGRTVGLCATELLGPLALIAYPRLRWRHPVDFLALVVIGGCGLVAVGYAGSVEVIGVAALVQGCVFIVHTWWRIELARDRERQALVWLALALAVAGLVYFVATFSAEGVDDRTLPILGTSVLALIGPALYVGATLTDLVDVRGRWSASPSRGSRCSR
jgi:uncharacterized membrane protein HdeD (DUF308 family)